MGPHRKKKSARHAERPRGTARRKDRRDADDLARELDKLSGSPLPSLKKVGPRHVAYVRSLIAKLGVTPSYEQEDLAQEVLIEAHRSRSSPLEPRALLFGITRHVVFRWIARREHERTSLATRPEDELTEGMHPSAEDQWLAAERGNAVREAIAELPEIFRDVLVRCEIEGMQVTAVARELGIPINTCYTRLHIARARFAEAVRRYLARRRIAKDDLCITLLLAGFTDVPSFPGDPHATPDARPDARPDAPDPTPSTSPREAPASLPRRVWSSIPRSGILAGEIALAAGVVAALFAGPLAPSSPPVTAHPEPSQSADPERPSTAPRPRVSPFTPTPSAAPSTATSASTAPLARSDTPIASRDSRKRTPRAEGTWAREIVSLARAGKLTAATSEAAAFRRNFPRSTYLTQIERALAGTLK